MVIIFQRKIELIQPVETFRSDGEPKNERKRIREEKQDDLFSSEYFATKLSSGMQEIE